MQSSQYVTCCQNQCEANLCSADHSWRDIWATIYIEPHRHCPIAIGFIRPPLRPGRFICLARCMRASLPGLKMLSSQFSNLVERGSVTRSGSARRMRPDKQKSSDVRSGCGSQSRAPKFRRRANRPGSQRVASEPTVKSASCFRCRAGCGRRPSARRSIMPLQKFCGRQMERSGRMTAASWTAAGSGAPRRFRTLENFSSFA